MPKSGHKRSPEAIAKFSKTMAAKRATGWKPHKKKKTRPTKAVKSNKAKPVSTKTKHKYKKRAKSITSIPLDLFGTERPTKTERKAKQPRKAANLETLRAEMLLELIKLVREAMP